MARIPGQFNRLRKTAQSREHGTRRSLLDVCSGFNLYGWRRFLVSVGFVLGQQCNEAVGLGRSPRCLLMGEYGFFMRRVKETIDKMDKPLQISGIIRTV